MQQTIPDLIQQAYRSFNSRNIHGALETFHPEVEWPKAFEGGYIRGYEAIRDYWTRQWSEINPKVTPVSIDEVGAGKYQVTVHQLVKDLEGGTLFDGTVIHSYTVEDGLLRRMDIETA